MKFLIINEKSGGCDAFYPDKAREVLLEHKR